jgi:hypothetical protein
VHIDTDTKSELFGFSVTISAKTTELLLALEPL